MIAHAHNSGSALPRLLLAMVLLLAQSLAMAHQQDHIWAADTTVCDTCLSAQSLDGAMVASSQALTLSEPVCRPDSMRIGDLAIDGFPHAYDTRAPPATS